MIVSALQYLTMNQGGAYVIFGHNVTRLKHIMLNTMTLTEGVKILGVPWSWAGFSVSRAGKIYILFSEILYLIKL